MSKIIKVRIVYDGDCPFCRAYVRMLRLQEHYKVHLIDARGDDAIIAIISSHRLSLDDGMVVEIDGKFFHGHEAMTRLALMTANNGFLRRVTKWTFKNEWRSRHFYPILREGRSITLKILGNEKISNLI